MSEPTNWIVPPLAALERLYSIGTEARVAGGGRVIVSSVEVWSTCTIIHGYGTQPEMLNHLSGVPSLSDDLGNEYQAVGGGGWNGRDDLGIRMATTEIFRPALARDASQLTLSTNGVMLTFELSASL